MKYLAAFTLVLCAGPTAWAQGTPPQPQEGLRTVVQQGPQAGTAPRQLSADERAELRRQLGQHGRARKGS